MALILQKIESYSQIKRYHYFIFYWKNLIFKVQGDSEGGLNFKKNLLKISLISLPSREVKFTEHLNQMLICLIKNSASQGVSFFTNNFLFLIAFAYILFAEWMLSTTFRSNLWVVLIYTYISYLNAYLYI